VKPKASVKLKPASKAQMQKAAKKVVASLAKQGVKPIPIAAHHPKLKAQMLRNANMHPEAAADAAGDTVDGARPALPGLAPAPTAPALITRAGVS